MRRPFFPQKLVLGVTSERTVGGYCLTTSPAEPMCCLRVPYMDARRSFYLNSKQDDLADPSGEIRRFDRVDIPYVVPANDNLPAKISLSARCQALIFRLITMRGLN